MPPFTHQLPAPSKIELEILAVLWDQPSATGRAVYEALGATGGLRRPLAYTTVKTYLDRLVQKGYIRGQPLEEGRSTYQYTALASREAVRDHPDLLARMVRVFHLTPAAFLRWCEAHGQLNVHDIDALRRLVQDCLEPTASPTAPAEP